MNVTYKALRVKPRNTAGEEGVLAPPQPKNKDLRKTKRHSLKTLARNFAIYFLVMTFFAVTLQMIVPHAWLFAVVTFVSFLESQK